MGLAAVAALIAATAFFVAAEFALVTVDRHRIEQQAASGSRVAQSVLALLKTLSFQLTGAQLGITIAAVVLGLIAEPTVVNLIEPTVEKVVGEGAAAGVSLVLALTIATVLTMVIGELVPKNVAIARPETVANLLAGPYRLYGVIAGPFIRLSDNVANWSTRKLGVEPAGELRQVPSLADLDYLIKSSGEEGTLEPEEVVLLTKSIRFGEKCADEVMVPRVEVQSLDAQASVTDLVALSARTGKSRFPIVRGDLDQVAGVVHVKAALGIDPTDRSTTSVTSVMSDVLAVPESRDLVSIMVDMRRRRLPLAVVVDEHGGTAGIVSMEDLLEEIVGEIDDEYDDATEVTVIEGEGVYVLAGGLHLDEVRDGCGFEMPEGRYETLAGFVLDRLQRIPAEGEVFRHDGWRIEVVEVDGLRVATLRLHEPWTSVQARLRRDGRPVNRVMPCGGS